MLIPEKRIADFEKMGFGMFVHWGLYSQLGKGEWYFYHSDMKMEDYKKLQNTFTAEDFDAEKLVLSAKNAGCKYITLTTRHHEGFSLYDTCGLNEYDAPHSPAGRDLVREFTDACRKHDIVPFFYHTTLDWEREDFETDFDSYLEYLRQSVEILCRNYGPIGGLWFDGNWSKPEGTDWKLDDLYGTIRKYQPDAMIINNTGLNARGEIGHCEIDSVTFEQGRPSPIDRSGMKKYVSAEMCYTLNDHWGIGYNDFNYKSTKEFIECLCDCRKVGANFLLNIGPTAQGGIVPIQEEYLKIIGRWMNIFGEAIYNGKPYIYEENSKHFILKGENNELYIFVYDLGQRGDENVVANGNSEIRHTFSGVSEKIKEIRWMDEPDYTLEFSQDGDKLTAVFPGVPYGCAYCVRVAKAICQ